MACWLKEILEKYLVAPRGPARSESGGKWRSTFPGWINASECIDRFITDYHYI
jgi:hypothetical protein